MKNIGVLVFAMLLVIRQSACLAEEIPPPENSLADFCKNYPRKAYSAFEKLQNESDWFELYQVSAGVTAIVEPHQWQEVISYLIEGDKKALLFDTGNGIADIAEIVKTLTTKPVTVLNSHTHYDHVGGNFAFDKILGMNTAFTRVSQQGISNKEIAIEVSASALCKPLPSRVTASNHVGKPFKVSDFIDAGHQIDLGNRVLEVLHIPGHTPDAIALIDRESGLLWTGDSFYSGPIWLYSPETDLTAYRQSLERLIKEVPNLKALLPAHNTPWVSPSILSNVLETFDAMINGKASRDDQGDGMIKYSVKGEKRFSFIMRDEPLPYR